MINYHEIRQKKSNKTANIGLVVMVIFAVFMFALVVRFMCLAITAGYSFIN